MKSVKPGRGPSMLSGVVGIAMVGFGILWTALAFKISGVFAIFGVLWTVIAIVITVYNLKNAMSKNRYSAFDITSGNEEPDPLNERFGATRGNNAQSSYAQSADVVNKFCPYCGTAVEGDFEYCNNCGRKLP